jgi:metal-responsive CopG/Arc/MetJ family transcriptional regulator
MRRSTVASFSLPPDVIRYTDEIARSESKSRSEVVREALETYYTSKQWDDLQAYGAGRAKRLGIRDEKDVERIVHEHRRKKR